MANGVGAAKCEEAFMLFKGNIDLATSTMNAEVPRLLSHLENGVFSPVVGSGREVEEL